MINQYTPTVYLDKIDDRITADDLAAPGLSDADKWRMMLRHFLASSVMVENSRDVLQAIYAEYKAAQKREQTFDLPAIAAEIDAAAADPTETDLQTLQPHLGQIMRANGTANRSAIARVLGVAPGGSQWQRISTLAKLLEEQVDDVA